MLGGPCMPTMACYPNDMSRAPIIFHFFSTHIQTYILRIHHKNLQFQISMLLQLAKISLREQRRPYNTYFFYYKEQTVSKHSTAIITRRNTMNQLHFLAYILTSLNE